MCKADPRVLTARYVPNGARRGEEKIKPSFLVNYLAGHYWVPDREGKFLPLMMLTQQSLHPDFTFDDRNGWLTAIGFGEEAEKRSEGHRQKNEAAQFYGFVDGDRMELAARATEGMTDEELQHQARMRELRTREDFPEKPSADPERRRRLIVQRRENAPAREKVRRERTIELGLANVKAEAKAYLRGAYTNENDRMICQCCREPMPFKLPKTEQDYFEVVQFVKGLDQQFYENYLALCPTCSAKYQHACTEKPEDIKARFLEGEPDGQDPVEIEIELAGRPATLKFVGTHALDLKVILENPLHG